MNPKQKERFLRLVQKVPSPHNTQSFVWEISSDHVELWVVSERLLHVGDKELRDLQLSAGAAFALAELALKEIGLETLDLKFEPIVMKPEV